MSKIVVSIDMNIDNNIITKLSKLKKIKELLLIIDFKIIKIVADSLIENGWLGEEMSRQLQSIMAKNLYILREKFENTVKEKIENIEIKKIDGNFKEILLSEIKEKEIKEIVIVCKKGFNIYWNTLKHVLEEICKKEKIKLTQL